MTCDYVDTELLRSDGGTSSAAIGTALDTPRRNVVSGMTERVPGVFALDNAPFVDKAVPREAGHGSREWAVATIR